MSRSEKLILVKDVPAAIVEALDVIFGEAGFARLAAETIQEDFTPLLAEEGGPWALVMSPQRGDWVACVTSLSPEADWDLAESLARALRQPVVYALFAAEQEVYVYRYFEDGQLHEEARPGDLSGEPLDESGLLVRLEQRGIDVSLVDDRVAGFGEEHLVLGYSQPRREAGVPVVDASIEEP